MRASISVALVTVALLGAASSLSAQHVLAGTANPRAVEQRDTATYILTGRTRMDLINDVLVDRLEKFAQPLLVDWCGLSHTAGPGIDVVAGLDSGFRAQLVLRPPESCVQATRDTFPTGAALVDFEQIAYEANEYIPPRERLGPRLTGLIVVRARVFSDPSSYHAEEWVMRAARPGVWTVVTVRIFDFVDI
jgi:hypothetical protein